MTSELSNYIGLLINQLIDVFYSQKKLKEYFRDGLKFQNG